MVDLIALAQGFNAARSVSQIVQTMIGLRDSARFLEHSVELNRKVADVLAALNAAHNEQAALLQTINEQKEEIAQLKEWEATKNKYYMEKLVPGKIVFTLKAEEAAASGAPIHHICPTCYTHNRHSILQQGGTVNGQFKLHCYTCGTGLIVGDFLASPVQRQSTSWLDS
jgi:hypothetical protein